MVSWSGRQSTWSVLEIRHHSEPSGSPNPAPSSNRCVPVCVHPGIVPSSSRARRFRRPYTCSEPPALSTGSIAGGKNYTESLPFCINLSGIRHRTSASTQVPGVYVCMIQSMSLAKTDRFVRGLRRHPSAKANALSQTLKTSATSTYWLI